MSYAALSLHNQRSAVMIHFPLIAPLNSLRVWRVCSLPVRQREVAPP
jgi:hypothetical protein